MISKKVLVCVLGFYGVLALAQTQTPPRTIQTANNRVEVLGEVYAGARAVAASQSRLVIYSLEDMRLPGATSIFVNGVYHASVVQGAYSDLCYAPGVVELGARQAQVGQRPKDRPDSVMAAQLAGGQTHYLRVREQGGRPVLQSVAAAQAERELPGKREQIHTISRVAQACQEVVAAAPAPAPAPVVAEAPRRHTLAADMLFASARSDRNGISSEGLNAIERLVGHINKEYSRIDAVRIVGHADPLGNFELNERLSQERANTIRQFFEGGLQQRAPITSVGRGSRELVVTSCSRVRSPESRLCNQPNRRVDIEVIGLRR